MSRVGLVAIGRNEGQRLRQCLLSVIDRVDRIVYVDSGSTDGSVELARSLGVHVVELDLSIPFTAARARNTGLARLLELDPTIERVQFVDGDCEVVADWLEKAQDALDRYPEVVVVCGRRRERFPSATIYNRLCDIEWDTPIGDTKACGGDALMRVGALQQVGGYNPALIAGEEPEMCVRLRKKGGKILRIDAEMTLHDAQITQFGQWWKRSVRSGHAFAEGAWMHGAPPEKHWVKDSRSIWLWGLVIPALILVTAWFTRGLSLLLLLLYPLMAYKIERYLRRSGRSPQEARLYAGFCMLAKFPQAQGQLQFLINKLLRKQARLIEYNSATSGQAQPKQTRTQQTQWVDPVQVLNVTIDNFSMREFLEKLDRGFVITPNVDHLMKLQKDAEFYRIYREADYSVCDSQIVMKAAKFLGTPLKEKISGSDFFPIFCTYHRDNPDITIFLLGGAAGVADRARTRINARTGREIVIDSHSPSFGFEKNEQECQELIDRINRSQATVLAVGVGAPKQEKWISKYRDRFTHARIFLAVGATIDFEAGTVKRAPKWMSQLGLEWLFRIASDPKRLWKRYVVDDLPFFWLLLKQKLGRYQSPFPESLRRQQFNRRDLS
ncbi:MAG TPA: WecB/TagA/CpsF family glycosyltransferase [Thermosynechococcaceae cyanobacterium]